MTRDRNEISYLVTGFPQKDSGVRTNVVRVLRCASDGDARNCAWEIADEWEVDSVELFESEPDNSQALRGRVPAER